MIKLTMKLLLGIQINTNDEEISSYKESLCEIPPVSVQFELCINCLFSCVLNVPGYNPGF